MYTDFFGLKTKPFSITPDPKFLYMSPYHREALAHLIYGIRENTGFVIITGEVGTGKTTLLNALLLKLPENMPRVVIKNPRISASTIYKLLGRAIGIPEEKRSRDHIQEYEKRLKEVGGALIVVDEAQGLSIDLMEEIRLLSNLETSRKKLIQIILLGQQELNNILLNPKLRQLKQRIGIKFHIPPLNSEETADYIEHRLKVAGYEPRDKPIFTPKAISEIYKKTGGFPRLINIVCDNAMLDAYTEDVTQIGPKQIKKVVLDMDSTYTSTPSGPYADKNQLNTNREGMHVWKMALIILLSISAGAGLAWYTTMKPGMFNHIYTSIEHRFTTRHTSKPTMPDAKTQKAKTTVQKPSTKNKQVAMIQGKPAPPVPPPIPISNRPKGTWVTVKAGDTIAVIAADYYGMVNIDILKKIQAANPQIKDMNLIYQGEKIFLPDIVPSKSVVYSVSIASYHSMEEAKAVFKDLVSTGFDATLYPYMSTEGKTWYRITIGTFESEDEAIVFANKLKGKGFLYAKPVKITLED